MFKALGRDAKRLARVAGFEALSLSETAFSRFTITRCRETAEYNRYVKASSSNVAHSCAQTNFKARSPTHPPYTLRTKPKDLHNLVLGATTELLDTVLLLLDLLAGLGNLLLKARTDHTVLGLELLHGVNVVVDQTEPSGLATTKLSAEAEEADARVVRDIVHLGELLAELRLRKKREEEGERRSVTSSPREYFRAKRLEKTRKP